MNSRDITANRSARWVRFLRDARNGVLLERPSTPPLWQPHKVYYEPMWNVLQSSYSDVEHELRVMCGSEPPPPKPPGPFKSFKILFVAGDGLALMRLNHLLANKADLYIHQTPLVIPIQGARASLNPRAGVSEQYCVHVGPGKPPMERDWGTTVQPHRSLSDIHALGPCCRRPENELGFTAALYGLIMTYAVRLIWHNSLLGQVSTPMDCSI